MKCEMKNEKSQKLLFLCLFIKCTVAVKEKSRVLLFCPGSEIPIVVMLVQLQMILSTFLIVEFTVENIDLYNNHSA